MSSLIHHSLYSSDPIHFAPSGVILQPNSSTFIRGPLNSSTPAALSFYCNPLPPTSSPCWSTMAMELTWSLDYCLGCDKQTQGEAYCSPSCRLADHEGSFWSGPTSPATSSSTAANRDPGFYLSPAIDFATYRTAQSISSTSPSQCQSPLATNLPRHTSSQTTATKSLTPSSSRTSLSSTQSNSSSTSSLSEPTRTELLDYTNSLDSIRNWKRTTWS